MPEAVDRHAAILHFHSEFHNQRWHNQLSQPKRCFIAFGRRVFTQYLVDRVGRGRQSTTIVRRNPQPSKIALR